MIKSYKIQFFIITIINIIMFFLFSSILLNDITRLKHSAEVIDVTSNYEGKHVVSTKIQYLTKVLVNINGKSKTYYLDTKSFQVYKEKDELYVYILNGKAKPAITKESKIIILLIILFFIYQQYKTTKHYFNVREKQDA